MNKRILGLDIGKKFTGLALSDYSYSVATHYKTIYTTNLKLELNLLIKDIYCLVVGLPLNVDCSKGEAALEIIELGNSLEREFNIKVFFEDERLTSWEARERLKELNYKPAKIKELEHQISAQIILQSYLNGNFHDKSSDKY